MSISNSTELKTAIADHLHRTDLTTSIPDFIRLAEAKLNRSLQIPMLEASASLSTVSSSNLIALPSRFHQALYLKLNTGNGYVFLERMPTEYIDTLQTYSGIPNYYRIGGDNIEFECNADAVYTCTLRYYKQLDINSDSTNDLLTKYPDCYLYASLIEGFRYLRDWEAAQLYSGLAGGVVDDIKHQEGKQQSSGLAVSDIWGLHKDGAGYNIDIE